MGEVQNCSEIEFIGMVPTIIAQREFRIKYIVRDGEERLKMLEHIGGNFLGIPWHTQSDTICMPLEYFSRMGQYMSKCYCSWFSCSKDRRWKHSS